MFRQKDYKKGIILTVLVIMVVAVLSACSSTKNKEIGFEADTFAMGTIISQKVYGANAQTAVNQAVEKIEYLEELLTFNGQQGDIYKLNQNAGLKNVELNPETIKIIEKAQQISELSNGAFDITVGPLVKTWGIGSDVERIPTEKELQKLLLLVDYRDITIDNNIVGLKEAGQMVDLGGIAKGYAGDAVKDIYKKNDIQSAFINLGGNVVTLGNKPDGSPWNVGIRNPRPSVKDGGQNIGIVKVTDKAVVTAGDDQRYFEQGGLRYHHILDPSTGYPAKSDLMSVSLITDSSLDADALDTAVFILGLDKGRDLLRKYGGVEAVFITTDKKVYITDGLKGNFEFLGQSAGYEFVE